MTQKINKSDTQWREQLTPEAYRVTRQAGTEPPFTGEHYDRKDHGRYRCICCGAPLFASDHKYDSGSGWPSYWQPVDRQAVTEHADHGLMMKRVEVRCASCDAHLGHVFNDGPHPTGLRYCINSAALDFESSGAKDPDPDHGG